jgi:hypothetical protein
VECISAAGPKVKSVLPRHPTMCSLHLLGSYLLLPVPQSPLKGGRRILSVMLPVRSCIWFAGGNLGGSVRSRSCSKPAIVKPTTAVGDNFHPMRLHLLCMQKSRYSLLIWLRVLHSMTYMALAFDSLKCSDCKVSIWRNLLEP